MVKNNKMLLAKQVALFFISSVGNYQLFVIIEGGIRHTNLL